MRNGPASAPTTCISSAVWQSDGNIPEEDIHAFRQPYPSARSPVPVQRGVRPVWQEYVNRQNNFQINMPGEPTVTETQYRTVKGTMLPARVFTAVAPEGSVTAGTYKVTIVDYSTR